MNSKNPLALSLSRTALAALVVGLTACAPEATSQTPPLVMENTEQVQAEATRLRLSFIVNFTLSHALGQAQSLESAGRHDEAARLVAATLREDAALRGLCFERFTLGGAEIVLSVCAFSSLEESFVTQRRWLAHLGATPGVAYVERNLVADHDETTETHPS